MPLEFCSICSRNIDECTSNATCIAGRLAVQAAAMEKKLEVGLEAVREGLTALENARVEYEAMEIAMRSAIDTLTTFKVRMAIDGQFTVDRMALITEAIAILSDALPTEGEKET